MQRKINKETSDLNNTIDKMDLSDIYRNFHPMAAEDTLFSRARGTSSSIDSILGHKTTLNRF